MHELVEQLLSHLKAAWRYRWYAVVLAWIIALGGWIAVYLTPVRYEAFARVYVDTQSILRPLLSGLVVQPNVDQMVAMMSKTLVSRSNLEKVIRMADLDLALKSSEDREKLLVRLSKDLNVQLAGRDNNNMYAITYTDRNPQEAKRVVQSLLTIFIEGRPGDKRKDSDAAQRFIEEQLTGLSEKLVAAENAVTEFKRRNLGLLPGGPDYYAQLVGARNDLSQAALDLKEAEDARDSTKKKLVEKYGGEGVNPELSTRIQALEQKLDALRLNYTEQHPDIVALVRAIAQLKEQREAEAKLGKSSAGAVGSTDPVYQQLSVSLATAEAKVASIKARVAEYGRRYERLKAAADRAPQVEAEYKQLTRDYDATKSSYANMLAKRESAQISGDMAADASVIDFRVVDPPQVRVAPKALGRAVLMTLVLLGALAGGCGLAFLISQMRPTFNDERRLRELIGLQVLGTVVMSLSDAQKVRQRRGRIALLISVASLFTAYAAIIAALALPAPRIYEGQDLGRAAHGKG